MEFGWQVPEQFGWHVPEYSKGVFREVLRDVPPLCPRPSRTQRRATLEIVQLVS